MPEAAFKIIPGVDQNRTPTLNEAALSSCNFVRFIPDKQGLGLVQKLGGWQSYRITINGVTTIYPTMPTITRALWAWEDTNAISYLAIGNQANATTLQSSLKIFTAGNTLDISPQTLTSNVAPSFSATVGSNVITVVDASLVTDRKSTRLNSSHT